MKYKILSQFVKPDVKFDADAKEAVENAISYYNTKSLIAKNPKQISDYSFSEDRETLEIILESEEKLPMPSKALRMLSTYLVQKTCIGENGYLAGKQLFKMTATEIAGENAPKEDELNKEQLVALNHFKKLDVDEKLNAIYELLLERRSLKQSSA